ncbi:ABC transporter ATP-binding protein [Candidatus Poribacteria bacterium]|nr:ABC transporter ATP-binding protein [Candidatus Poribacteria bacterium]
MALFNPLVLRYAVDSLTQGAGELQKITAALQRQAAAVKFRHYMLLYGVAVLSIAVAQGVFRFFSRNLIGKASHKIEYDMRNDFFAHLQKLSASYYNRVRIGDIMARATNDLHAVRRVMDHAVMYTANTTIFFIAALIIMLRIDVSLTLFALIPFPIMTILIRELGTRVHKNFEKIQEGYSNLSSKVQENLAGVRVVKAYNFEKTEVEEFKTLSREFVNRNRLLIKLTAFFFPFIRFWPGIGTIVVLWLGGTHVVDGKITLGEFVAFNSYLMMLVFPMVELGFVINAFQQGAASMGRISQIMDEKPEIQDAHDIVKDVEINGEIEFRHLTFAYNSSEPVLRNINLKIPRGSTLAIVGPTGSGKSTLINLILRLYNVEQGCLFIDGIDITQIPLHTLRSSISYVSQEPYLFSEAIGENITYGLEKADQEKIREASDIAQLLNDVESFTNKFDTELGERGVTVSGGQKQRIALARAIIIRPKILILDDAFASVDTNTEEEILTRLKDFMKERTSIIISHRVSTVKAADLIIVLMEGEIVEQGNHDDLLALDGIYAELHRKQLLKKELEEL